MLLLQSGEITNIIVTIYVLQLLQSWWRTHLPNWTSFSGIGIVMCGVLQICCIFIGVMLCAE